MKKLITLATLVMLALPMFAQEKPAVSEEPNVVKVNTLSLLVGTGSLFYERKLSDNLSGQMGVGYLSYKIEDSKFSGLILTPEVRFYPKSNAIDGFYLAVKIHQFDVFDLLQFVFTDAFVFYFFEFGINSFFKIQFMYFFGSYRRNGKQVGIKTFSKAGKDLCGQLLFVDQGMV